MEDAHLQSHGQVHCGGSSRGVQFEGKQFGLAMGFVESTSPLSVLLRVSLSVGKRYQVQRDELSMAFPLYRTNILKVLMDERLRRLILQKQAPRFSRSECRLWSLLWTSIKGPPLSML